jgi:hypothetical protein
LEVSEHFLEFLPADMVTRHRSFRGQCAITQSALTLVPQHGPVAVTPAIGVMDHRARSAQDHATASQDTQEVVGVFRCRELPTDAERLIE